MPNLGGWECTEWREGDTHLVPLNDLREHEQYNDCWCKPTEDVCEPNLWIHHSLDRRELYEENGNLNA